MLLLLLLLLLLLAPPVSVCCCREVYTGRGALIIELVIKTKKYLY